MIVRVRVTPGGHDEYGDPVESTEKRTQLHGCAVAPRSSGDARGRGLNGTVEGLTLYAPLDTDLASDDLVEVSGVRYRIDGEVGVWSSPQVVGNGGKQVALVRAKG